MIRFNISSYQLHKLYKHRMHLLLLAEVSFIYYLIINKYSLLLLTIMYKLNENE